MRLFVRALIAVVFVIGVVNLAANLTHFRDNGTFGFALPGLALSHPTDIVVRAVDPGSPAARAGIHAGDALSYERTFETRIQLNALAPGDRVTFYRNGAPVTLTAVLDESPIPWALFIIALSSKIAFLLVGIVIAWRRPQDAPALALSLFLVSFGAAIDFDFVVFTPIVVRFFSLLFIQLSFVTGGAAMLAFACLFPSRASSGTRRFLARLIAPTAVIGYLSTFVSFSAVFVRDGNGSMWGMLYLLNYLVIIAATMTALVASYRESQREDRARMRWVLGTFAFGFSGLALLFVTLALRMQIEWGQYASLTIMAIPFGLAYVILRHRVIDIGFVVNRAVVYTGVSVVVVGVFIIFEWLIAHVVEENSRASTLLNLGGALALGLSVRFIHTRVDRWVDDLFFRDRHHAEAAIRRFAHEAALITDPDVLVSRTVDVAQRNGRLNGAAFYGRLGSAYVPLYSTFDATPESLDENDPAILDMRTWHQPVDRGAGSAVPGFAAFPMVVRGELSGFLTCGEKTTHEEFAPDERDALRVLARDAGIALDSLRISRIERELAYLSADGELPASVRMRLSSLLHSEDGTQPAGAGVRSIK